MALTALAPAFERTRKNIANRSTRAVLRLVPDLKPIAGEQASTGIFVGLISSILVASLLALLAINIALGNDAVHIRTLKLESIQINEDRESALRELDAISGPEALATSATALGMVPGSTPTYIDLSVAQTGANTKAGN